MMIVEEEKYLQNLMMIKMNLIPLDSFVKIIYPLEKFESVIKIPETALFNKQYIFVIKNGRAKKIKVNVIHSNTGYYLLKNDNLDGVRYHFE